ncbi:MAG: dephospho-CoA kinase [Rugosibacter sp.]|nr:MAG: dephospho-CoA kinase [Rugosibacter sp.]TBR10300.1 MAG: dephospho-CoA kinase [Rugosibacter sp.]
MSYLIGLTGGIGSGKSAVADLFAAHRVPVIDTDAVSHMLTAASGAAMPSIRAGFGENMAMPDGALDRAAMRAHIFAQPEERKRLEAILHPLIRAEVERRINVENSRNNQSYIILVVPLLIESGTYRRRVQRIAVVDCSEATQIRRVMARNGLSQNEVERILQAQATRAERLAVADDVIENDGQLAALTPQVARLHDKYLALAGHVG